MQPWRTSLQPTCSSISYGLADGCHYQGPQHCGRGQIRTHPSAVAFGQAHHERPAPRCACILAGHHRLQRAPLPCLASDPAVRDERGSSYFVHSDFRQRSAHVSLVVLRSVPNIDHALPCLELELELYWELANGNLSPEVMSAARDYLLNRYPFDIASTRFVSTPPAISVVWAMLSNYILSPTLVPASARQFMHNEHLDHGKISATSTWQRFNSSRDRGSENFKKSIMVAVWPRCCSIHRLALGVLLLLLIMQQFWS